MSDVSPCVKDVYQQDAAMVVVLSGEIDLHQAPDVHQALIAAIEDQPQRLLIDLNEVGYMDSSGVGTLVEIFRRVHGYGGNMILFGVGPRVRSLFEITRLDQFFTIVDSREEALKA